jgi:flavin-dependent dehydrogenase
MNDHTNRLEGDPMSSEASAGTRGRKNIQRVAILGGGPAGACLATYLGRAGLDVVLFHQDKQQPVIVGESLVPAIVPYLRRLGIEEEVADYSIYKKGATFVLNPEQEMSVFFNQVRGAKTPYSYNVPREKFDASILNVARRHATVIECKGGCVRDGDSDRVLLDAETLARCADVLGGQPDLIVDSAGRSRILGNLMGVEIDQVVRADTALHAHVEGVEVKVESNIHTDRMEHGWCWRIPLPGKVSVGIVVDSDYIAKFGNTPEECFDTYLSQDAHLREWMAPAERVTPVVQYTAYQIISTRGVGENWALLGDAFGFIDPVFSSGLLLAFLGADELAKAILDGSDKAFARYEKEVQRNVKAWQSVIRYWYDGRLLTLFQVADVVRSTPIGKLLDFHFRKHMPRIFTGEDATNPYSLGLVKFMATYGLAGNDPERNRIL